MAKKAAAKAKKRPELTAKTADRHILYQASVQDPELETENVTRMFKRARKRRPFTLREDFCGTAIASATWVLTDPERTAFGLDLDRSVLEWGRKHNLVPLGEAASRVDLRRADVCAVTSPKVDLCTAFNFSYCIFRERPKMLEYFRCVRESLVDDGVFMLDLYGGWDAGAPLVEDRKCKVLGQKFTYVWEQAVFSPIDHYALNHIHFRFPDGSEMKRAFSYAWRLWTAPELVDLLHEAGFTQARVWWEDEDADGESTGRFRPRKKAENQAGFIAYILAEK
ncbi:MAG: class I SAM-dependent methyltransferase [Planctomycetes bacterium]|nr:class I SAM-dependent methyltransferase [Planctomycetota bacterium]